MYAETINVLIVDTQTFPYNFAIDYTFTNSNSTYSSFTAPANFYTEDLIFEIISYNNSFFSVSKPVISGHKFIGKVYDFNFRTLGGSSVTALNENVSITLSYSDSDISGADEGGLAIARWNSGSSSWVNLLDQTINLTGNTVTAITNSFSSFAIIAPISNGITESNNEPDVVTSGGGGPPGLLGSFSNFLGDIFLNRDRTIKGRTNVLRRADFNGDGLINIVDFSILLYYFNSSSESSERHDLNNDKVIDLVDLSILFFYWDT